MFHDIRAVLFDLDGTLIDSAPDLAGAARAAVAAGKTTVEEALRVIRQDEKAHGGV